MTVKNIGTLKSYQEMDLIPREWNWNNVMTKKHLVYKDIVKCICSMIVYSYFVC